MSDVEKFAAQRLCYECDYMDLYYDAGYSEWTPGEGFVCRCWAYHRKPGYPDRAISHWEIDDVYDMSKGKLRECLQKAATCPDFKAVVVKPTLKERYEQRKAVRR
jgi:hypothetical protein